MFRLNTNIYISFLLFLMAFSYSNSQNIQELKNEKQRITERLQSANKLIAEYNTKQQNSQEEIKVLDANINNLKRYIEILRQEIDTLDYTIRLNNELIEQKEKEINALKREMAGIYTKLYKIKHKDTELAFILSSENITEFYRRLRYLKQILEYKNNRKELQIELKNDVQKLNDSIASAREEYFNKSNEELSRVEEFVAQRNKKEILVKDLRSKRKQVERDIEKDRSLMQKLEKQIEEIISREAKSDTEVNLTLNADFEKNKGRFSSPLRNSVITSKFGKQRHSVFQNLEIENNGINLSGTDDFEVRSIFGGVVTAIVSIPGANNTVLIRHGRYITVYQNLLTVFIKKGDEVEANEIIGKIKEIKGNHLHFEIRKENVKLNPEEWLRL